MTERFVCFFVVWFALLMILFSLHWMVMVDVESCDKQENRNTSLDDTVCLGRGTRPSMTVAAVVAISDVKCRTNKPNNKQFTVTGQGVTSDNRCHTPPTTLIFCADKFERCHRRALFTRIPSIVE